jgi:hypothetical protein
MRFSPRSILDDSFLGKGVALWRGGSGFLPRLPREGGGVEGAGGTLHLSPGGGAGCPGPPNLFYIHIRLLDEALFQSLYRPFRCGRHNGKITNFFTVHYRIFKLLKKCTGRDLEGSLNLLQLLFDIKNIFTLCGCFCVQKPPQCVTNGIVE